MIETGEDIVVEERAEEEVLTIGGKRLTSDEAHALNPAFDVTPARYITSIITEKGVYPPQSLPI
jgi:methylthioribose-1-phosphate isomerase